MDEPAQVAAAEPKAGDLVRRHRLSTRIWHWINAVALIVMLMSGLMIFNAHPRLYWGEYGANPDAAWLALGSMADVAFPGWATIPSFYSLADARLWHLFFAWVLVLGVLVYLPWSLANGHLRRDLWPDRGRMAAGAHLARHQAARPAALSHRRRGAALQHPAEAGLSRRAGGAAAAGDPHRPRHVAGVRRGDPCQRTGSADGRPRARCTSSPQPGLPPSSSSISSWSCWPGLTTKSVR